MQSSISARGYFSGWVWLGLAGAPLLLLLELTVSYAMIPWTCERTQPVALHLVIGGALIIVVAIAGLSSRRFPPPELRRERFLRELGVAISALVALVVALQWLTALILQPCISSL